MEQLDEAIGIDVATQQKRTSFVDRTLGFAQHADDDNDDDEVVEIRVNRLAGKHCHLW